MSGLSRRYDEPKVVNIYGSLMASVGHLQKQFGIKDLQIVLKNGRYYLDIDGQLIEIVFLNGKLIDPSVVANLLDALVALLIENGFKPVNSEFETDLTPADIVGQQLSALVSFLGIYVIDTRKGGHSAIKIPELETVIIDDFNDTITLDYDQQLNAFKLPTADDFEILVNGAKVIPQSISISSDKVELQLSTDIQTGDQIVVRYFDQAGDQDNSIQNLDGLLASAFFQGIVIDGYVSGAQIYLDKNGDGIPDQNELVAGVTTNDQGIFLLEESLNPGNVPILIVGGVNVDTGLANNAVLSAPPGSTVITPTTTLIQTMVRENIAASPEVAELIVETALGLDVSLDLLKFDPIAAEKNPTTSAVALEVHKFNTSVVAIMDVMGGGSSEQANKVKAELAKSLAKAAFNQAGQFAFDATLIGSLETALGPGYDGQTSQALLGTLSSLESATNVEAVADVQKDVFDDEIIEFLKIYRGVFVDFTIILTNMLDVFNNTNEIGLSLYYADEFEILSGNEISLEFEGLQVILQGPDIASFLEGLASPQDLPEDLVLNIFEKAESVLIKTSNNETVIQSKILDDVFVTEFDGYELRFAGNYQGQMTHFGLPSSFFDDNISVFDVSVSVFKNDEKQFSISSFNDQALTLTIGETTASLRGDWSNLSLEDRLNFIDELDMLDLVAGAILDDFISPFNVENIKISGSAATTTPVISEVSFSFGNYLDSFEDDISNNEVEIFLKGHSQIEYAELILNSQTYKSDVNWNRVYFQLPLDDLESLNEGEVPYDIKLYNSNGVEQAQYGGTFIYDPSEVRFEELVYAFGSSTPDYLDGTAGIDGSGDDTVELILDVSDASKGDTIELYVDGEKPAIFSQTLTAENITAGNVNTGELAFSDEIDQDVFLEIAVKRSDGVYIQHDGQVTWEYQW